jgi:hypothetical protein
LKAVVNSETINYNYKVDVKLYGGTTLNGTKYSNSKKGKLLRVSEMIII